MRDGRIGAAGSGSEHAIVVAHAGGEACAAAKLSGSIQLFQNEATILETLGGITLSEVLSVPHLSGSSVSFALDCDKLRVLL